MEAVERWRASIPEESETETAAGAALIGAGVVAAVVMATRRRSGFWAWAVPGALIAAGIALLTTVVWDVRSERIEEVEAVIEEELASLDPLARAQVLHSIGQRELGPLLPGRD